MPREKNRIGRCECQQISVKFINFALLVNKCLCEADEGNLRNSKKNILKEITEREWKKVKRGK